MNSQDNQPDNKKWKTIAKWSGLGIEFGGVVAIFTWFGLKLDEKFDTSPWFLLTGIFVGVIGMLYIIIKDTRNLWKE
jgi:ATP synthase protein I